MPTYQYACTDSACGNRFELVQSFTDPAASECPVCNGPVRKVFSAVGVVFKGSGFYRTDSRAGAGAGSSTASGSGSKGSGSGSGDASSSSTSSTGKDSSSSTSSTSSSSDKSGSGGASGKVAASA